jgi:hypothetical protein
LAQVVEAAGGVVGQLVVRAEFTETAVFQNHDQVGALYRLQAVSDDDASAVLQQLVYVALDQSRF